MELLTPFALHRKFAHCEGCIVVFDGSLIKNVPHKSARALRSLIWEIYMAHPFLIDKVMFMVGNYNEFKVLWIKIACELFVKDNSVYH